MDLRAWQHWNCQGMDQGNLCCDHSRCSCRGWLAGPSWRWAAETDVPHFGQVLASSSSCYFEWSQSIFHFLKAGQIWFHNVPLKRFFLGQRNNAQVALDVGEVAMSFRNLQLSYQGSERQAPNNLQLALRFSRVIEVHQLDGSHPAHWTAEERLKDVVSKFHITSGLTARHRIDEDKFRALLNLIQGTCPESRQVLSNHLDRHKWKECAFSTDQFRSTRWVLGTSPKIPVCPMKKALTVCAESQVLHLQLVVKSYVDSCRKLRPSARSKMRLSQEQFDRFCDFSCIYTAVLKEARQLSSFNADKEAEVKKSFFQKKHGPLFGIFPLFSVFAQLEKRNTFCKFKWGCFCRSWFCFGRSSIWSTQGLLCRDWGGHFGQVADVAVAAPELVDWLHWTAQCLRGDPGHRGHCCHGRCGSSGQISWGESQDCSGLRRNGAIQCTGSGQCQAASCGWSAAWEGADPGGQRVSRSKKKQYFLYQKASTPKRT